MHGHNSNVKANVPNVDWNKIFQGEIIVRTVRKSDGLSGVQAMFSISATRDEIWKVLIDYDNFPKIFDGIDKIKVIREDDNGALIELWIDTLLIKLHYILYRYYEKPGYKLSWNRVSGDLESIEGSWEIFDTPHSEDKLLVYNSYINMGRFVPNSLIRGSSIRRARSMGIRIREWIKNIDR